MLKAIIFDMDGVLLDTSKYIWKVFKKLFGEYGVKIKNEDIKNKYLGRSLRDQIELIRKDYGIKEKIKLNEFSEKSTKLQLELMKDVLNIDKSILKLISSAKKEKIKIAVATSSGRPRAEKILKLLGIFSELESLITAHDVEKHKPNPQMFLKTAEKLKVSPKNCVVFEDARNGIQAAKSAKMLAIGLITDFQTKSELKEADLIINNFSEIDLKKIQMLMR